ncbi:MAG: hypothetical protein QMC89_05150 [Candidatus Hodarchaeaceae archaeon]|nr:hypothetical protein [Candidatus Hodarchaeaceae archaeon]
MGEIASTCAICGRTTVDIRTCRVCGVTVCSRCFLPDIGVCAKCMRRGLWVSDRGPG